MGELYFFIHYINKQELLTLPGHLSFCFDIFRVQNMGHSLTTFTISDGKKNCNCVPLILQKNNKYALHPFPYYSM